MPDWVSFSEVKRRVTLAQALHGYQVDWLRGSGPDQYRGRCPIHQGQGREAFHANLRRGVFHCFACGAGGNVLDFVAAMEGCSIRQAALRLQGPAGRGSSRPAAPSRPGEEKLVTKKREGNPPLGFALDLDPMHPYLIERGLDAVTIGHFGVGYYGWRGLMSGRIAIPIHDDAGRLIAYCGRAVNGAEPRYRFPAGFQKSQVLFNYHRARSAADKSVIVVEGFFDCMRVHQAGFPTVVALMGARLSPAQQQLLTGRFSAILLMLDGDATGRAAMAQIAKDLAPACRVHQLRLPPNAQPDQMSSDQIQHVMVGAERRARGEAN
jgi:DNA primase